jgi:hypothetical protein
VVVLFIQFPIRRARLFQPPIQFIDLGQALVQQDFQSSDSALPVFDLAPQEQIVVFNPSFSRLSWSSAGVGLGGRMVRSANSITLAGLTCAFDDCLHLIDDCLQLLLECCHAHSSVSSQPTNLGEHLHLSRLFTHRNELYLFVVCVSIRELRPGVPPKFIAR